MLLTVGFVQAELKVIKSALWCYQLQKQKPSIASVKKSVSHCHFLIGERNLVILQAIGELENKVLCFIVSIAKMKVMSFHFICNCIQFGRIN
jgi:hypothetical protein